jgi:DNA-directed RNA polymerase III subunit RPC6
LWVKTIKAKLNLHQKNVDQSIKTLLQRGHIRSMTTVKFPRRKMYILAGLQPGEDATGGAWFTDGVLDHELMESLARELEYKISTLTWREAIEKTEDTAGPDHGVSRKRKEPEGGFNAVAKGKQKMKGNESDTAIDAVSGSSEIEGDDPQNATSAKRESEIMLAKKNFIPYHAGYAKYPTLKYLTDYINDGNFVQSGKIPENNVSQLLDVMAYDDRIIKVSWSSDSSAPTMYKARRNTAQIKAEWALEEQIADKSLEDLRRMKAFRELEVKKLGSGGTTEIPCGRCPVFDMCEVGGPVNPNSCEYFEKWFIKLESNGEEQGERLTW